MRLSIVIVAFVVAAPLVSFAQPATPPSAEKKAQARERYDEGARKYDLGRFEDAIKDFEAAYELSGAPEILFNIGTAARAAKHYDKALLNYRAYLRRVAEPPQRELVEKRIAELTELIKQQEQQEQQRRQEAERQRQAEEKRQEDLAKQRHEEQMHADQTPAPPRPLPRWLMWAGVGVGAVGVAGLATGVALSLLARSAADTVQRAAAAHGVFDPSLRDTEASGKAYDTGAIACYAVGGALAVTGAVLIAVTRTRARAAAEHAHVVPFIGATSGGLVVEGRF